MQSVDRAGGSPTLRSLRWAVARARSAYRRSLTSGGAAWDLCIVTAANERQAEGCAVELESRRDAGLLPAATRTMVLADPNGARIGSGGATRLALLRAHSEGLLFGHRVLIIHSGGDSRGVPHCAPLGKLFQLLPLEREDGAPLALFDLLYAALSPVASGIGEGVLVASGDVLLAFDGSGVRLDGACVCGLAVRCPWQVGSRHGVYVTKDKRDGAVLRYLQKPSLEELKAADALDQAGHTAVDSGLLMLSPHAATALMELPISEDAYMDLYADLLPALPRHADRSEFLAAASERRAVREAVWSSLRVLPLRVAIPEPAAFDHFDTTDELRRALGGETLVAKAYAFSNRAGAYASCSANADGAVVLGSVVAGHGLAENGAILDGCSLDAPFRLGARVVLVDVNAAGAALHLRPGVCLQAVPVDGPSCKGVALRLYGAEDDPRLPVGEGATLLGVDLLDWLREHGIQEADVWPDIPTAERCLWNARLYPVVEDESQLGAVLWMQDRCSMPSGEWQAAQRTSLAESSRWACVQQIGDRRRRMRAEVIRRRVMEWVHTEAPSAQAASLLPTEMQLAAAASTAGQLAQDAPNPILSARFWRFSADLHRTRGRRGAREAAYADDRAFLAVRDAVALMPYDPPSLSGWALPPDATVVVEAPARLDLAGGWSDTPPYSLECGGAVLNAAILLDGSRPVRAWVRRLREPIIRLVARDQQRVVKPTCVEELRRLGDPTDPLGLHKAALILTGVVDLEANLSVVGMLGRLGGGVEVGTEAVAPKGSGLGTSSILGWALLAALHRALGVRSSAQELFAAVLRMEQMLTTGGGWQDQVGGATPGIKLLATEPGLEQRIRVQPVALPDYVARELSARLVLFYTGKRRLAKNILRTVMGRWMSRDPVVAYVLARIKEIAAEAKRCLELGDVDRLGALMAEHWELNKLMDPLTTDPGIDRLWAAARPYSCGGKLAGAGGGGFMMMVAKNERAVLPLKRALMDASGMRGAFYQFELDESGPAVAVTTPQEGA